MVAREIRRLADQAAVATLDIEQTILEVQGAIKDGVAGVEKYTLQTKLSSEKTARISDELGKIIEHSKELGPQVEVVNLGMQTHSQNSAQISNAMEQISETANQTRESLVEFRKITEQLNEAVIGLQEVSSFSSGHSSGS